MNAQQGSYYFEISEGSEVVLSGSLQPHGDGADFAHLVHSPRSLIQPLFSFKKDGEVVWSGPLMAETFRNNVQGFSLHQETEGLWITVHIVEIHCPRYGVAVRAAPSPHNGHQ